MNRRTLAFLGAAVLAVVGAGLLFLSARGSDDDGSVQAAASDSVAVTEPDDSDGTAVAAGDGSENDTDGPVDETDGPVDESTFDDPEPDAEAESGDPDDATEPTGTGVAEVVEVPDEMVEITAALDTQRAIGGQVRPGDLVGIIISYDDARVTDLVLHKILVSNVQDEAPVPIAESSDELLEAAPSGRFYVTFALQAADAEKLAHGLEFGRIWLTYEPETADETSPGVQSRDSVIDSEGFLPELDATAS